MKDHQMNLEVLDDEVFEILQQEIARELLLDIEPEMSIQDQEFYITQCKRNRFDAPIIYALSKA
jgi:uncharacterized protein YueI